MSKSCILKILDEVNIKFEGLDPNIRRDLVKELKFDIPGARFMDVVKAGRWDGKESFFTSGGRSYLNLLDILVSYIERNGYEISQVIDQRIQHNFNFSPIDDGVLAHKCWPPGHPHEGEPIVLRDYQVKCVNDFLSDHQCIQEISTAAGKTIIVSTLSHIIEQQTGGRTIVIVPNKFLVGQTAKDYQNIGLDVGVYFGDQKDIGNQHTICTWQSLNNLEKMGNVDGLNVMNAFLDGVNCIMVDETHLVKASVLKSMLTDSMSHIPIRWGLTGTLPEDEYSRTCLLVCIGNTINYLTAKELQDKGVLAECHVNIVQIQDKIGEFQLYPQELKFLVTDPRRVEYMAKSIKKIAESGNTLVLVDRIKAGQMLEELIEDSIFLSGDDKNDVREYHYEKVSTNNNKIIIATYGIASTGVNIPRVFNLVMIEPGKSYIKVIQSIGRGIRKAKDKDFVNIWDFTSSLRFSKRHLTKRKSFYKKVQYPFNVTKVVY